MKLHRLELEGFGPFRERQVVDFDAFVDDGLFLISGRTGAGKSSVLDGVCFALYGGAPRYDGSEKRLRSDHCTPEDPTRVSLEFSSAGSRWRITRLPEYDRPKQRGEGLTTEPHRAQLDEWSGGEWIGRAARPVDVAHVLEEILGLSQQQFLQVILLAQNRFAQFLLAKNDDRQKLLRTLFGTRAYEDYARELDARRKASEQSISTGIDLVRLRLDDAERLIRERGLGRSDAPAGSTDTPEALAGPLVGDQDAGEPAVGDGAADNSISGAASAGQSSAPHPAPGDLPGRIASVDRAVQRAAYRGDTLAEARTRADNAHRDAATAHTRLTALRDMQLDRERSRAKLTAIEAEAPAIAEERERLHRAARAEGLRTSIDAVTRASELAARAERAQARAIEDWVAAGETPPGGYEWDSPGLAAAGESGARGRGAGEPGARERGAGEPGSRGGGAAESGAAAFGRDGCESRRLDDAELSQLRDRIDRMAENLGEWAAAVAHERQLADLDAAVAAAHAEVSSLEELISNLDAQRAHVPTQLAALTESIAEQSAVASTADGIRARVEKLEERLASAKEAAELADSARAADEAAVALGLAMQRASARVTSLLQRRLAGHAGELAANLTEGEPCPVCGSIEHPSPAPSSDDPVTDDAVADAEQEKDAAVAAEREASDAARVLREALATAMARAGGAPADELEQERDAAAVELATTIAAATDVERLSGERQHLQKMDADAAGEKDALVERLASARETAAAAATTARAARAIVDSARGDAASVAERVEATTRLRDRGRALVTAAEEYAVRVAAAHDALVDRDSRIADSDFDDAEGAVAALLSEQETATLEQRVREHETSLRAVKEKLLDLELALVDAPDDVVDVETSAETLVELREAWSSAVEAAADAAHVAAQLTELATLARDAHEGFSELAEDHAILARLADTVAGHAPNTHRMTLESFVLAAELEEIVDAANLRLDDMSSGRYRLRHTDARAARNAASGLGLEIVDAYTGQPRPAQSLSGGETFLASLALALGLAEVVTARAGGVRLDTLFVDEGFGSLDSETLDLAMRTLDELRQGGRTVGVISHVEAMKEQIPAQLVVEATRLGPSFIRQDLVSAASMPA